MTEVPQFQRHLRLFDSTTIVVGSMIGSGIFIGLSIMAQWVETPGLLIGLWIFGELFTMLGAVACAELAAMYPHAGGQYVFLREAYGDFWAFFPVYVVQGDPLATMFGLLLMLSGIPFYVMWKAQAIGWST